MQNQLLNPFPGRIEAIQHSKLGLILYSSSNSTVSEAINFQEEVDFCGIWVLGEFWRIIAVANIVNVILQQFYVYVPPDFGL